jgi:arylsulfatase A-like enzyme
MTSFNPLCEYFENKNNVFEYGPPPETLATGLTKKISQILELKEIQEPYFCYFHFMDLHPLREGRKSIGIEKFDNEEFGSSSYARTVSSIDYWLGKILKKIDIEKTLLVITGDHGERIPFDNKVQSDFQPKFDSATKFGKKHLPGSTHKISGKIFGKMKNTIGKAKLSYSNTELTPYQKRSRDPYFTLSLFDELIHVPLIFSGIKLPQIIISRQVSLADIFPTIYELIDLPTFNMKTDGRSLTPLINGETQKENPIYLQTMPYEKPSALDSIGLRTSKYKYFRSAKDSTKKINLYDLKKDPQENNNIVKNYPLIVEEMEKIISEITSTSKGLEQEELSKDEEEKIRKELKKLGYM